MRTVPRRARRGLTAAEHQQLKTLRERIEPFEELIAERNQTICRIYDAGASVEQISKELGLSREAAYLVIRRRAGR